jgi:glucose-1-phosphate adenylyltransferase
LALTAEVPDFDFYEPGRPIYTHPRFLPNSKVTDNSEINHTIISEGCIIDRAKIDRAVIGVRSVINAGSVLKEVIMLGQDSYESPQEREETAGLPARGIGADCQITRAIIDKNARIGDGVIITSHLGKPNEDGDCYHVRDGIVVIPKNSVVPDGRKI